MWYIVCEQCEYRDVGTAEIYNVGTTQWLIRNMNTYSVCKRLDKTHQRLSTYLLMFTKNINYVLYSVCAMKEFCSSFIVYIEN